MDDPDLKKRGRRPNNDKKTDQPIDTKAKKGRKPKTVYNAVDASLASTSQLSSLSDDENIIVKLNIKQNVFCCEEDEEDDDHPCAYNSKDYSNLSVIPTDSTAPMESKITKNNRVLELLKDFEEKNKNNEWPSNTSIACYWCCHKFNNAPFGIPINFKNDKFEVIGCFCSLECAASYNFKNNDNVDEMWERYNLINLMCRKMNEGNFVKPAPDILALKMFGGHLEIDKFREFFKTNRILNVNFPPMTSITQQLEEINENELNNEYKFIPIDNDRINKYKEKILFKRTKPLINNSNSLENTMKLTYT